MKLSLSSILAVGAVLAALTGVNVCTTLAASESDPYKIGIVDLQQAMDNYNRHKSEVEKLQVEFEKVQGTLEKSKAALDEKLKKFEEEKDGLSEDEIAERQTELQQEVITYDGDLRAAQADLNQKKARLKQSLLKDLVNVIQEVGAAEQYHLILEADPETRTGVLYHASAIDMTSKVIARLNR
jgi:Skp family chaperone for outer membrane proteins